MSPRTPLTLAALSAFLALAIGAAPAVSHDDDVLFPSDVSRITPLQGSHVFLRSRGTVTQLLLVRDGTFLTLYTDRMNRKDDDITASAYSRADACRKETAPVSQGEFRGMIEGVLAFGGKGFGDMEPFPGLESFMGADIKMKKTGSPITIRKKHAVSGLQGEAVLVIDALRRSCTIRICREGQSPCYHPVVLSETQDTHLIRIIRHYYYRLYERYRDKGSFR